MDRNRPTLSGRTAALLAAVALALPAGLTAQQATLSLEEAIQIARQNNPAYLTVVNDAGPADWAERQAYAGILPTAGAQMSGGYQAPGTPNFGVFTASDIGIGKTPAYYSSSYGIFLGLTLSPGTFFEMKRARRARQATDATIRAEAFELASTVTVAYLAALRGEDAVELAQRQLEQAEETMELAQARVDVGEAIPLDGKQAQVGLGRAQVALLQAQNLQESQQRRLAQQLGVRLPDSVSLTSEFELFEPAWTVEELVAEALPNHPQLRSLRARASAAKANLRSEQGSYLPTLQLSAGWSGFAREVGDPDRLIEDAHDNMAGRRENCEFLNRISAGLSEPLPDRPQDCSKLVITPEQEALALRNNDVFPFGWNEQPMTLSATVSLPLFTRFNRQLQVAQARNQAEDADYQRRAAELDLRAAIAERLGGLEVAYDVYQIEQANYQAAQDQVELARERYRLGAGTFLDLLNAQAIQATADRDLLNARYTFHEQLVGLEAAVGRQLRRP